MTTTQQSIRDVIADELEAIAKLVREGSPMVQRAIRSGLVALDPNSEEVRETRESTTYTLTSRAWSAEIAIARDVRTEVLP